MRFTGLGSLTGVSDPLIARVEEVLPSVLRKTVEVSVREVVEKKLPDINGNYDFE